MIEYLLAQGYVKLRDNVNADTDDYIYELKEIENGARIKQTGLWSDKVKPVETVPLTQDVISKSQKTPVKVIVEKLSVEIELLDV